MKAKGVFTTAATSMLPWRTTLAADENLPIPVLEWSFYVLLVFALVVAVGIFFKRGKERRSEPLGSLLGEQRQAIHSVTPDCSVTECVRQMNAENIGAMLVMEKDQLLGIFTERDAITKVLGKGLEPSCTTVAAVMSHSPTCVTPDMTLEDAMAIVSKQRVRHLPVVEDGKVLGMVSSGDLTYWLVKDRSGEFRELADFVGRRRDSAETD